MMKGGLEGGEYGYTPGRQARRLEDMVSTRHFSRDEVRNYL